MNKHLLFIPFLALLATSCGGGHITSTPVVKNAPSASLTKPTKKNLIPPQGYANDVTFSFSFESQPSIGQTYYKLDGSLWQTGESVPTFCVSASANYQYLSIYWANGHRLCITDYVTDVVTTGQVAFLPNQWTPFGGWMLQSYPCSISGIFHFYTDYEHGYKEGYDKGLEEGTEDGYSYASNKLIKNGQYTGLTIFPRRNYLEKYANDVVRGRITPQNGSLDMISTDSNYTIYIKWTYLEDEKAMRFQDYGNTIIGQLDWIEISEGNWGTSWFGLYDAELHYFTSQKHYAGSGPIDTSFYPEVYLGSTFTGDPNLYFAGGGNGYAMGFADGQTYTIHANETYNNVFTIFTPAFRAVADFFNLNIGPFKVWYFFAIPLIVTLLILVLRLVKH